MPLSAFDPSVDDTIKDPDLDRDGSRLEESNISRHGLGSTKRLFNHSADNSSLQRNTFTNKHNTNEQDSQDTAKISMKLSKLEQTYPKILLQPNTRPISHEQLLMEG